MKRLCGFAFLAATLAACAPAFSVDWYVPSGVPSTGSQGSSAAMRSEFSAIGTSFNKMPTLTGSPNYPVFVNSGATALAAVSPSAARTLLGLAIGTDVEAYDADLACIAGLTSAADRVPYYTGSGACALATLTSAGRAIIDDADAAAQRTTLGLGTMATQAASSVAISGGTINGATVGQSTPAAGSFTTLTGTGSYTQTQLAPEIFLNESDQSADAKLWNIRGNGSNLFIRACDDAVSSCESAITISRSSNTIGTILFDNGAVDIDETLNVDGASTFGGDISISSSSPDIYMTNSSAGSNAKIWRNQVDATGNWLLFTRTDADGSGETALSISRSGTAVGTFLFDNGDVDIDENLNVDGTTTLSALTASTIAASGNITHSKACATNFTRAGPGFCARNATSTVSLTRDACTAMSLPAGATYILVRVRMDAGNGNGVGQRLTGTVTYSENTCSSAIDNSMYAYAYEFTAIASPGAAVLATSRADTIVPPGAYIKFVDDAGNGGSSGYDVLGYWDN